LHTFVLDYTNTNKKQKSSLKNKKDLGMACHTPETRGNAITQPWPHPLKNVEFRDGLIIEDAEDATDSSTV